MRFTLAARTRFSGELSNSPFFLLLVYVRTHVIRVFFSYSPPAIERLSSGLLQEVIVTNTLPVAEKNYFPQLTILSVANLLGETIWRVHDDSSVSSIFL